MPTNTPSIRRAGTELSIHNGVNKLIAEVSENNIYVHSTLTLDELNIVNLVAANFDLFYENVIEE